MRTDHKKSNCLLAGALWTYPLTAATDLFCLQTTSRCVALASQSDDALASCVLPRCERANLCVSRHANRSTEIKSHDPPIFFTKISDVSRIVKKISSGESVKNSYYPVILNLLHKVTTHEHADSSTYCN